MKEFQVRYEGVEPEHLERDVWVPEQRHHRRVVVVASNAEEAKQYAIDGTPLRVDRIIDVVPDPELPAGDPSWDDRV